MIWFVCSFFIYAKLIEITGEGNAGAGTGLPYCGPLAG